MSNLFSQVLNMTMTGSVVILLVMLARLILKRAPKIFSYALWSVVLFRLLCPVAFNAPVSVLNALEPEVQEASESTSVVYYLPAEVSQDSDFTFVPAENQSGTDSVQVGESRYTHLDLMVVASYVWIVGSGIMILYSVIQYIRLRGKLVGAVVYRGNVYRADYIDTPFVMGIFSPKIYLPSDVPMNERKYIIAHERHHIRRFDHIIKLLAYFALCVHWFNPLVWAAFILAGKDMEMSCDEAVIRKMGFQIRADYSASLLRLATHKKIIAGMPLAFGEGDTKGRVMNMAKWKKPKLWVSLICLLLCAVVLVACAVNPHSQTELMHSGEIIIGNLRVPLPDGYTYQDSEDGSISIAYEGNIVAGIVRREKPEISVDRGSVDGDTYTGNNFKEWVIALGLPEAQADGHYTGMIGDTIYGDLEAEYWDGQNPEKYDVIHYFYIHDTAVYDVWCDLNLLPNHEVHPIMGHIELLEDNAASTTSESIPSEPVVPGNAVITDTELVQYGTLKMLLPSGLKTSDENGIILLKMDDKTVGGVALRQQKQVNSPNSFSPDWMVEIGIPEASDTAMGYMSSGSRYADYEITYFPDIPVNRDDNGNIIKDEQGTYVLEHEVTHYFFVDGTDVYDIWFYNNRIPNIIRETVLKTCVLEGVSDIVAMQTALDKEKEALQQCRSVLEQIQSNTASKVETKQENGPFALNETSIRTDWIHGNNRLNICLIPESGGASMFGGLLVDGTKYECDSTQQWREITWWDWTDPWLVSFKWDDSVVAYMDTLTDESGITVMLRIDQPFAEGENQQSHYFVNFNYDEDGTFRNVYVQTNVFMTNSISKTESIVSLDSALIEAEIQKEYKKAIG